MTVSEWSITDTLGGDGRTYETLSELPALAELGQLADIAVQLSDMLRTPPLVMLVNPNQMDIQYSNIQAFSDRTRYGYIFQHWGQNQVRINFQGKIGAFIAGEDLTGEAMRVGAQGGNTSTPTGVQFASKRNSASWQNFMALFSMYRNAGYIYDTMTSSHLGQGSNAHYYVGAISITYDQFTYVGHIENFAYKIEENNQLGGIEYTMTFVASQIYDNKTNDTYLLPMKAPVASGVGVPAGSALYGTSTANSEPNTFPEGESGWQSWGETQSAYLESHGREGESFFGTAKEKEAEDLNAGNASYGVNYSVGTSYGGFEVFEDDGSSSFKGLQDFVGNVEGWDNEFDDPVPFGSDQGSDEDPVYEGTGFGQPPESDSSGPEDPQENPQ